MPPRITDLKKMVAALAELKAGESGAKDPRVLKKLAEWGPGKKAEAAAQNFDVENIGWHGTPNKFDALLSEKMPEGFHIGTEQQAIARAKAQESFPGSSRVFPVVNRGGKFLKLDKDIGLWTPEEVLKTLQDKKTTHNIDPKIIAASKRKLAELQSKILSPADIAKINPELSNIAAFEESKKLRESISAEKSGVIDETLKSGGYGGIEYPNNVEGEGFSKVIYDPTMVRHPSAAFDPAKRNTAKLAAGLAGATALGGAALSGEDAEASNSRLLAEKAPALFKMFGSIDPISLPVSHAAGALGPRSLGGSEVLQAFMSDLHGIPVEEKEKLFRKVISSSKDPESISAVSMAQDLGGWYEPSTGKIKLNKDKPNLAGNTFHEGVHASEDAAHRAGADPTFVSHGSRVNPLDFPPNIMDEISDGFYHANPTLQPRFQEKSEEVAKIIRQNQEKTYDIMMRIVHMTGLPSLALEDIRSMAKLNPKIMEQYNALMQIGADNQRVVRKAVLDTLPVDAQSPILADLLAVQGGHTRDSPVLEMDAPLAHMRNLVEDAGGDIHPSHYEYVENLPRDLSKYPSVYSELLAKKAAGVTGAALGAGAMLPNAEASDPWDIAIAHMKNRSELRPDTAQEQEANASTSTNVWDSINDSVKRRNSDLQFKRESENRESREEFALQKPLGMALGVFADPTNVARGVPGHVLNATQLLAMAIPEESDDAETVSGDIYTKIKSAKAGDAFKQPPLVADAVRGVSGLIDKYAINPVNAAIQGAFNEEDVFKAPAAALKAGISGEEVSGEDAARAFLARLESVGVPLRGPQPSEEINYPSSTELRDKVADNEETELGNTTLP